MQRVTNPIPLWLDASGNLLDGGSIYIGVADGDPETDPISLFTDEALTQAIAQPLRTLGGVIVDGANTVFVYADEDDYSIRVRDANGQQVAYIPSAAVASDGPDYQPLDSDLTAIAALATTSFGRGLLTLANQAALQAAVGTAASLPLTGGTMTGNIVRQGAGIHPYFNDAAMTGGRIFITDAGAADPTSLPGDIWIELE